MRSTEGAPAASASFTCCVEDVGLPGQVTDAVVGQRHHGRRPAGGADPLRPAGPRRRCRRRTRAPAVPARGTSCDGTPRGCRASTETTATVNPATTSSTAGMVSARTSARRR